tara:strand:- start:499 stop:1335 length:837 start_codon:yes stop_codon:yes gene_type:complete
MSFIVVGASIAVAAGGAKLGMSLSGRKKRIEEQRQAKQQMEERMEDYESLDTSNLAANVRNQFTNMENVYEDLTVNQQQAQFEAQQGAQQRANIMQGLQGAAGGSGIAGLAQAMAQQGQLATQRASASIGAQEADIQRLRAGEASRLQTLEREGEQYAEAQRRAGAETARGLEWSKTGTLLGMSQERLAAANEARAQAKAQQMSAIGDIASAGTQMMTAGMETGAFQKKNPMSSGALSAHTGVDMETNRLFNETGGANTIYKQGSPQSVITNTGYTYP